jgi:hypothetical protein
MKAYLKWAYWYKNFWDEVLLFGVINRICANYNIKELVVEVWEIERINKWIRLNQNFDFIIKNLDKVKFISIKQDKFRILTHLKNILWLWKYKKYFKFFGWWQVLDDSRNFPHDWRNLILLYNHTIRKWNFALLGWIWSINKKRTKLLYNYICNRAKNIIVREPFSFNIAKSIVQKHSEKIKLYNDFSLDLINSFDIKVNQNNKEKYILVNLSIHALSDKNHEKIKRYCDHHQDYKKIYFYCDYYDDKNYFNILKKGIQDLEYYDWRRYDIKKTLELFKNSNWWIWARLHFLYPLKLFGKKYISLTDSDKINNLIDN